jgi:hypothetical protein
MNPLEGAVEAVVRGIVNHREGDPLCIVRVDSPTGMGNLWMPVQQADYPAGYWPPRPGDVLTMCMPVLLALRRPGGGQDAG